MKLLINSSTFKGTGVTQVAVSFINECIKHPENDYIVFMSPNVKLNIQQDHFPDNFKFYTFGRKSLYSVWGITDLMQMKKIEKDYKPDAVFSVFGPSLWKPKAPHLQGYAYPYYVYQDSPIYDKLSLKDKLGVAIRKWIHIGHMKNEGKYFVCETEDVSNRLHKIFNIDRNNIFTVSNTANAFFLNYKSDKLTSGNDDIFRFYSLCSNSPHKNLAILNEVIPILKNNVRERVLFYVTIPYEDYEILFNSEVKSSIVNVGPLKVADCPAFVDSCDALFLPTLLECFSASYPEAMLLGKPIITSDLPFAREVCDNAALYFNPLDANDIADKIAKFVNSKQLRSELMELGKSRLRCFLTPAERTNKYLEICKYISGK